MRWLTLVLLVACASKPRGPKAQPRPEASPAQWEEAWDLVTEFGEPKAELGPWRVENAGAIIVSRVGEHAVAVPDIELQAHVESSIAPKVPRGTTGLRVQVAAGVVHLHGGFSSRKDAGWVVWAVLPLRGVDQVVSYLTWPGSEMKPLRPRLRD